MLIHHFQVRGWLAFLAALAFALDPLQTVHERLVMSEAVTLLVMALEYLKQHHLGWLIAISLAGVTLTALRLVHVPAVWVVAVLLPACTFRQSLPRPKLRAASALAVSVGSTLVLQLCYQETVCILKQREPAYHRPLPDGRHSANVETRRRR